MVMCEQVILTEGIKLEDIKTADSSGCKPDPPFLGGDLPPLEPLVQGWCNSICVLRGHRGEPWRKALNMAGSPQTLLFRESPPHLSHSSFLLKSVCLAGSVGTPVRNQHHTRVTGMGPVIFLYYPADCQLLTTISSCHLNHDTVFYP